MIDKIFGFFAWVLLALFMAFAASVAIGCSIIMLRAAFAPMGG